MDETTQEETKQEETPKEEAVAAKPAKAEPGKWTRRFCTALGLLLGVILPFAAFGVELATGACSDMDCDPLPNLLCAALVLSVPTINLLLWWCYARGRGLGRSLLHVLAGFSAAVSFAYALFMMPLALGGIFICVCLFWYLGVGLIGLLPNAPLFGCITACCLHVGLRHQEKAKGLIPVRGFGWGWLAALAVGLLALTPTALQYEGLHLACSSNPDTAARGVRLLRRVASDADMRHHLGNAWRDRRGFFNGPFCGLAALLPPPVSSSTRMAEIFYRVTGEEAGGDALWSSRRGRRSKFALWDFHQSGETIGETLSGLSLKDSAWETKIDEKTAIGYGEWTLVFANTRYADREARLRIDLPKGAVVSRATLWIGGEEREAAFGTKGQVRKAYESVVRRNHDPLLVNASGPNQIQVQCFPVPPEGEMKIRLGITMPLAVTADGQSLLLTPPVISSQNFVLSPGLVGFPDTQTIPLKTPPAVVAVYADKEAAALKDAALVQRLVRTDAQPPRKIAVVFDTSASMKTILPRLLPALKQIPADAEIQFWAAGDVAPTEPFLVSRAGDPSPCRGLGGNNDALRCSGGRDNVKPLLAALDALVQSKEPSALFWIHGPQPVGFPGTETFAAKLAGAPQVRLFLCPVASGADALTEKLRPSPRIVNCPELFTAKDPGELLGARFASLTQPAWTATYEKVATDAVPAEAVPADRHLARLWAAAEVVKTYRVGDPKTLEAAQQIALPWQIVTPVTGAVVLETAQQYKDNDLTPAEASSVPTTPEPESILLFALTLVVLVCTLLVRAHRQRRMNAQ